MADFILVEAVDYGIYSHFESFVYVMSKRYEKAKYLTIPSHS